jgi:hypothetical protein
LAALCRSRVTAMSDNGEAIPHHSCSFEEIGSLFAVG